MEFWGFYSKTGCTKNFPDRANKVLNHIRSMHGGKLNDSRFGVRMGGEGNFASQLKNMMILARKKYGLNKGSPDFNTTSFIRNPTGQLGLF